MQTPNVRGNTVKPYDVTIDKFNKGYISLLDESRLPESAARQSQNLMLTQDGLWSPRWGTKNYGTAWSGAIQGWCVYTSYDANGDATEGIIIIDGTTPKKSTDGGAWTTLTKNGGAAMTYTAGKRASMVQLGSRVYIANGTDDLSYYDIDNDYMVTYTGLSAPSSLTATGTGLTGSAYTYYYYVTAVNDVGETTVSNQATETTDKQRTDWAVDGTEYITLSWISVSGATRYNIYVGDESGYEYFLDSVETNSYVDQGQSTPNNLIETPNDDTTSGPTLKTLSVIGSRLWGIGTNGSVYWTGVGNSQGAFSPYYGGGYVTLRKGGRQRPVAVFQFRTGKGDPIATVLTSDPAGNGSTWQIELTTESLGSISVVIPITYQVLGTLGTKSPHAIVEARNNAYFLSARGVHTIGSKPSLLNILATDEVSVNVRPDYRNLNIANLDQAAGYEYDGKVFFAVPNGSTTPNQIWVLDLEQRAWALFWDLAMKGFIEYTDSSGNVHFLGVPVSGTQFQEFSSNFKGDNGTAFQTVYQTGLIHINKTHRDFAHIKEAIIELARPEGTINLTVSGTQKSKAFRSLKSRSIETTGGVFGFSSLKFSIANLSEPNPAPKVFSEASIKKYLRVGKRLNNWQIQISSSDLDQSFTIMRINTRGRMVRSSVPSSWKD